MRCDPARPQSVVVEPSSMPHRGSRVADDVRLASLFAVGGALLFWGATVARERAAPKGTVATSSSPM